MMTTIIPICFFGRAHEYMHLFEYLTCNSVAKITENKLRGRCNFPPFSFFLFSYPVEDRARNNFSFSFNLPPVLFAFTMLHGYSRYDIAFQCSISSNNLFFIFKHAFIIRFYKAHFGISITVQYYLSRNTALK